MLHNLRPRHYALTQMGARPDAIFVGNEAEEKRGMLKSEYPMEKGYIRNMGDTYLLWLEENGSILKIFIKLYDA